MGVSAVRKPTDKKLFSDKKFEQYIAKYSLANLERIGKP